MNKIRFDIISANPNIMQSSLEYGLISRAIKKKAIEIYIHSLRDYAEGKFKQIDDLPYGGGTGMVLKPEPFFKCIKKLKSERNYDEIIYFTPQGIKYNQKLANYFSIKNSYLLLCGHYKGIDERIIEKFVTKEISIGDYVISCGELASLIFIDSISRLIPGVLGDSESAITDSFQDEDYFDAPQYTRPEVYENMRVPEVLLSGNHNKIKKWREKISKEKLERIKKLDL